MIGWVDWVGACLEAENMDANRDAGRRRGATLDEPYVIKL